MFKSKKTIEISQEELNNIIIAFSIAKTYMSESSINSDNPSLKSHFIKSANKYRRLQNKWIKKRDELFNPSKNKNKS